MGMLANCPWNKLYVWHEWSFNSCVLLSKCTEWSEFWLLMSRQPMSQLLFWSAAEPEAPGVCSSMKHRSAFVRRIILNAFSSRNSWTRFCSRCLHALAALAQSLLLFVSNSILLLVDRSVFRYYTELSYFWSLDSIVCDFLFNQVTGITNMSQNRHPALVIKVALFWVIEIDRYIVLLIFFKYLSILP